MINFTFYDLDRLLELTMLKLETLCQYLENLLSSSTIKDYCPNGLQVEGKRNIKRLATAVSANLATLEAAIEDGSDALIVHHGLFWQGESYTIKGSKKKKLALLLKENISLLAYHLPLDMHREIGNNWKAAEEMGWKNLQPFYFVNGLPLGVKGEIQETSTNKVKKQLEQYYEHEAICALGGKETIKSLALISGGAHKSLADAVNEQVDAYITGSFDEPVWHQAFEEKMNFFALGHSATERIGPRALASHLSHHFGIPCSFIDIFNPF